MNGTNYITNLMNFVSFDLIKWRGLAAGLSEHADWQAWSENGGQWEGLEGKLPADRIPPLVRRRMSTLSKAAVQCALMLAEGESPDYIIFSSRHGELTRTISLLKDILAGEDASPTLFSQSVHNTAASHYTIIAKKPVPVTSIGAGEKSLIAALQEAAAYLTLHPNHRILLVDFDEPLGEPFDQLLAVSDSAYAVGLILTGGDSVKIDLAMSSGSSPAINLIKQLAVKTGEDGSIAENETSLKLG